MMVSSLPPYDLGLHTNPYPLIHNSADDFFSTPTDNHYNLVKHFSVDGTSKKARGLNTSSSKSKPKKDNIESYDSLMRSVNYDDSAVPAHLFFKKSEDFLNKLNPDQLNVPTKKVKLNQQGLYKEPEKDQEPWRNPILDLFDNSNSNLMDMLASEELFHQIQPENKLAFWENDENLAVGDNENGADMKQVFDILKDKCEDIVNRTYFLEIKFAPEPEIACEPEAIALDEPCILVGQNENYGGNQETPNVSSESDGSPTPEKTYGEPNRQILREYLGGVTESDFARLDPEIYLNDSIINFYLKMIEHGFLSEERRRKCHFFNTYFMAKMQQVFSTFNKNFADFDKVYAKMGKWTKRTNIFEKDFVFIPINDNEHWNLAVLCYPSRFFTNDKELPFIIFFDSLSRMDNIYSATLLAYLSREAKAKMPDKFPIFQAKTAGFSLLPYFQHMVPKQSNYTDCGLFLLQYIELFAEDETYITNPLGHMDKTRWFPRKLIKEKRNSIKKIIQDLRTGHLDTIDEYLEKRSLIMRNAGRKNDEYDSFDSVSFGEAFKKKYGKANLTPQERVCLMLDYYYLGTLDYNQAA